MRVLHIITGLVDGGAEVLLSNLATSDKKNNHQVISLLDMGIYGENLSVSGVPVHTLNMTSGHLTLRGVLKLFQLIRKIKPDVVQTWMYHADLVGGMIARLAGKQAVVWGIHHSNLDTGKTSRRTLLVAHICAWLSRFVPRKIICCSEVAATVHVSFGYNNRKMVTIHNGINVIEFKPNEQSRSKLRTEWGIRNEEILLGMVARWDMHKDHGTLIAALAHLKSQTRRSWRCILVGSGMDEANQELVCFLNERGVRDRCILTGARNDIPAVMNAIDLHILSSYGEAFGIVTCEAMASGVPGVVTSVGAGELIVGKTGWVVPPSNPAALSGAILTAINEIEDVEAWAARKNACRKRVVDNFSLERMVIAYQRVWDSVL